MTRESNESRCSARPSRQTAAPSPLQPPAGRCCFGRWPARSRSKSVAERGGRDVRWFVEPAVSASTGRRAADRRPRSLAAVSQLDQASACSRVTGQGRRSAASLRRPEGESLTECLDSRTKSQSARTRCACSCAPISTRVPGPAPPGGCWSRAPAPGRLPRWKRPTPSSASFHRQRRPARLMRHSGTFAQARLPLLLDQIGRMGQIAESRSSVCSFSGG